MEFKYIQNSDTVRSLANKFNDNFNELAALNLENLSGENGQSGLSGISGFSGSLGISGTSGRSGISGVSGSVGPIGPNGLSGLVGSSGLSGLSGISGLSGRSGISGLSGGLGPQGISGFSGISGDSNGASGRSGISGISGRSGIKGIESLVPLTLKYNVVDENPLVSIESLSVSDTSNIGTISFSKNSIGLNSGSTINILLQITIGSIIRVSTIGQNLWFEVRTTDVLSDMGTYLAVETELLVENFNGDFVNMQGFEAYITFQNPTQSGIPGVSGISGRVGTTGTSGTSGRSGISGISGLSSSGASGRSGIDGGRLLFGSSTDIILTGTTTTLTSSQLQTSVINIYKNGTGNHTVNLPSTPFIPYQYIKIFLRNGNTGELILSGSNLNYNPGLTVETNTNTSIYKTKLIGLIYDSRSDETVAKPWIMTELVDTAWDVPTGI